MNELPMNAIHIEIILPGMVTGILSPYPTVVIVTKVNQSAYGIDSIL